MTPATSFLATLKQEAEFFADLLNSETARRFISALVFTDAKRPVTVDVLKRMISRSLRSAQDGR